MTRFYRGWKSTGALGLVSCALLVVSPARAEEAPAQSAATYFDQGLSLYQQGRMRDAAVQFLAAFRVAPHGDAMFNAGLALEASGDSAGAATAYAWALEHELRARVAAEARDRLRRLTPRLGTVRVVAPEGASVEITPLRRQASEAQFHALPGEVLVSATLADGSIVARRVRVELGIESRVDFTSNAKPRPEPEPVAETPAPETSGKGTPWRTVGWVALGLGASAGVAAVAFRKATLDARDDYVASGNTDAEARDRALSNNRWTNVFLVSAVVTGAIGGGLVLFKSERGTTVGLSVAPTGGSLHGSF